MKKLKNPKSIKAELHGFHIVEPSPGPICVAISLINLIMLFLLYFGYFKISIWQVIYSAISFTLLIGVGSRNIVIKSLQGTYVITVQQMHRAGFILVLISEAMFFFGFFWCFFYMSASPSIWIGCTGPPLGIEPIHPFGIPFGNTVVLLSSGVTVIFAHRSILCVEQFSKYIYDITSLRSVAMKILILCKVTCVILLNFSLIKGGNHLTQASVYGITGFCKLVKSISDLVIQKSVARVLLNFFLAILIFLILQNFESNHEVLLNFLSFFKKENVKSNIKLVQHFLTVVIITLFFIESICSLHVLDSARDCLLDFGKKTFIHSLGIEHLKMKPIFHSGDVLRKFQVIGENVKCTNMVFSAALYLFSKNVTIDGYFKFAYMLPLVCLLSFFIFSILTIISRLVTDSAGFFACKSVISMTTLAGLVVSITSTTDLMHIVVGIHNAAMDGNGMAYEVLWPKLTNVNNLDIIGLALLIFGMFADCILTCAAVLLSFYRKTKKVFEALPIVLFALALCAVVIKNTLAAVVAIVTSFIGCINLIGHHIHDDSLLSYSACKIFDVRIALCNNDIFKILTEVFMYQKRWFLFTIILFGLMISGFFVMLTNDGNKHACTLEDLYVAFAAHVIIFATTMLLFFGSDYSVYVLIAAAILTVIYVVVVLIFGEFL